MVIHVCSNACCVPSHVWLCDPLDRSPPGSSVHGVFLARILERVAISSSMGSSWPRDQICVFCVSYIAGGFFTIESQVQSFFSNWNAQNNWCIGWLSKWYGIYDGQRGANRVSQRVSSFVTKQDPMGLSGTDPSPISSALAPLWSV